MECFRCYLTLRSILSSTFLLNKVFPDVFSYITETDVQNTAVNFDLTHLNCRYIHPLLCLGLAFNSIFGVSGCVLQGCEKTQIHD